jgi:hypothetical protein
VSGCSGPPACRDRRHTDEPAVGRFFTRWRDDGTWQRVHDGLREQVRIREGRGVLPTAAVIDSRFARAAEAAGAARRGCDAGEKTNGIKQHVAVDTLGLLLVVMVTAVGVQEREARSGCFPFYGNASRPSR